MFATKVEITLPKAEPGKWNTLEKSPRKAITADASEETKETESAKPTNDDDDDSDLDLNDIEQVRGVKITDA